jgi:hypothetical protein
MLFPLICPCAFGVVASSQHEVHKLFFQQDGCMADRLLNQAWNFTMSSSFPPEIQQSNVVSDVLKQYNDNTLSEEYLRRCVAQVVCGQNIVPSLHVLHTVVSCVQDEGALVKLLEEEVK